MALNQRFKKDNRRIVLQALRELEEEKGTDFVPFFGRGKKDGKRIQLTTEFEVQLLNAGELNEFGIGKNRPIPAASVYTSQKLTPREEYESLRDYFWFVEGIGLPDPKKLTNKEIKEILDILSKYVLRPKSHVDPRDYQLVEGDRPLPRV
ncbi:MAG: hypothetical protein AB1468_05140, partial [Candidatus Micrarchaeota archaeon]